MWDLVLMSPRGIPVARWRGIDRAALPALLRALPAHDGDHLVMVAPDEASLRWLFERFDLSAEGPLEIADAA